MRYRSHREKKIGWLRHVLTALSVLICLAGVALLCYLAWLLATTSNLSRFFSGTLVFTYSVTAAALLLFLTGLLGWLAGASEATCLLKAYFAALVVAILAEAAGIAALYIMDTKMEDVLLNGWAEVNQGTRNIVQSGLQCCGFYGPREFAYTSFPIDESCYEISAGRPSNAPLALKQDGCGPLLQQWFDSNRVLWCSLLAGFGGMQLMSAVLCLFIVCKLADKTASHRGYPVRHLRHHHNYGYDDYM